METRTLKDTKDFFRAAQQRLFSNWTALKLVIEHGMGTVHHVTDFCESTMEFLYENDNVDGQELADHLETYMDDVFDTELQDNSSIEVANELLRFYRYCAEGNEVAAAEEFAKLPPLQSWILTPEAIRDANKQPTFDYDEYDDTADRNFQAQMQEIKGHAEAQVSTVAPDEWMEVKTRRRK